MKKEIIKIVKPKKKEEYTLDIDAMVEGADEEPTSDDVVTVVEDNIEEPPKKRGPGRPPKNGRNNSEYTDIVKADKTTAKNKKDSYTKELEKGYSNTGKLLYGAIMQADNMYTDIGLELDNFRKNQRYGGRNRMQHMSDFMGTQVNLINTKINAVRELNSIRNKINDLSIKHAQMMKDQGEENSDNTITDAYYAMLNSTHYGLPTMSQPIAPMSLNTGISLTGQQVPAQMLGSTSDIITSDDNSTTLHQNHIDPSFESYKENITPIQRAMIAEKDPNIKTVVVYNQSSGNKYFDVVNVHTGQSVPGIQRPADFLLDDMRIDANNGIAVNSNANMSFPLVITGTRAYDEL